MSLAEEVVRDPGKDELDNRANGIRDIQDEIQTVREAVTAAQR